MRAYYSKFKKVKPALRGGLRSSDSLAGGRYSSFASLTKKPAIRSPFRVTETSPRPYRRLRVRERSYSNRRIQYLYLNNNAHLPDSEVGILFWLATANLRMKHPQMIYLGLRAQYVRGLLFPRKEHPTDASTPTQHLRPICLVWRVSFYLGEPRIYSTRP